ncbi:hypothetical protein [Simkania sp.]|uniref:hypothetical protein n=1 Tax=Simkania sp. TaxID=34094 RepID=UPI003B52ACE9
MASFNPCLSTSSPQPPLLESGSKRTGSPMESETKKRSRVIPPETDLQKLDKVIAKLASAAIEHEIPDIKLYLKVVKEKILSLSTDQEPLTAFEDESLIKKLNSKSQFDDTDWDENNIGYKEEIEKVTLNNKVETLEKIASLLVNFTAISTNHTPLSVEFIPILFEAKKIDPVMLKDSWKEVLDLTSTFLTYDQGEEAEKLNLIDSIKACCEKILANDPTNTDISDLNTKAKDAEEYLNETHTSSDKESN